MRCTGFFIIAFISVIYASAFALAASDANVNLSFEGRTYKIDILDADVNEATLRVDDSNIINSVILNEQYCCSYSISSSDKVGDLRFIATNTHANPLGFNATVLIGIETQFNVSSSGAFDNSNKNITIDGVKYTVELLGADHSTATFKIGNISHTITETPTEPFSLSTIKNFSDFKIRVINSRESGLGLFATAIVFYEKKFYASVYDDSCVDECGDAPLPLCDGGGYRNCGNYDSDSCLEWSDVILCGDGKTCRNGKCEEIVGGECNDDRDCAIEATGSPYCSGSSVCINSLSYECVNAGTSDSYCRSTPTTRCTPCSEGCENDQCIGPEPPSPVVTKCDDVGIRAKGRYCGFGNIWLDQKDANHICENNFECRTNKCEDGICKSSIIKEDNFWIYVSVGIVIVALLIIFFVVKMFKRY